MKRRDMSKAEFDRRCAANGFVTDGFMGYYRLPSGINVSVINAGLKASYRERLDYLLKMNKKYSPKS